MDIQKTIDNLRKNEFTVSYFETTDEAAEYIDSQIDDEFVIEVYYPFEKSFT